MRGKRFFREFGHFLESTGGTNPWGLKVVPHTLNPGRKHTSKTSPKSLSKD